MQQPLLYKPSDLIRLLGLSRSKIYQLIAAGSIPSVRLGKCVRIPAASLESQIQRWLESADSTVSERQA